MAIEQATSRLRAYLSSLVKTTAVGTIIGAVVGAVYFGHGFSSFRIFAAAIAGGAAAGAVMSTGMHLMRHSKRWATYLIGIISGAAGGFVFASVGLPNAHADLVILAGACVVLVLLVLADLGVPI